LRTNHVCGYEAATHTIGIKIPAVNKRFLRLTPPLLFGTGDASSEVFGLD
jgi:hypothetical protein